MEISVSAGPDIYVLYRKGLLIREKKCILFSPTVSLPFTQEQLRREIIKQPLIATYNALSIQFVLFFCHIFF